MNRRTLVLVAAAAVLAPMGLYVAPQVVGGGASYAVLSGSMSPTFEAGDFIVTRAFERGDPLAPGDIVTFRSGSVLVTHRVVAVHGEAGARELVMKGDANAAEDGSRVPESRIVAKYMFHVPAYGHLAILAGQPLGKLLFIALPSALLLVLEVRKLSRSIGKQPAAAPAPEPLVAAPAPGPARATIPGAKPAAPPAKFQVVARR